MASDVSGMEATAEGACKAQPSAGERAEGGMGGGAAWRVAVFFAALFLVYGVHLPYLPVWLDWRGLTPFEIGIVTALPFFLRLLVTPAVAIHADQTGSHAATIRIMAWAGVAAAALLAVMPGFWSILAVATLFAMAATSIMPLTEAVAVSAARRAGVDYGRMRLWGSLSFVVASMAGGLAIERWGGAAGVWLLLAGAVLTALASHALPASPRPAASAVPAASRLPRLDDARRLVASPLFLAFVVAVGAIQAAHAAFYTFGSVRWRAQGLSADTVGLLWTIGVAAEVALFAWSGALMRRFWATTLIMVGGMAALLRWAVMAFDPPLAVLVPLQLLHGATYGLTHIGAIQFLGRAVPESAAGTAQALYASVAAGVAMGVATLAAGALYGTLAAGTYAVMAGLALAGLVAALWLRRRWAGELIW